jgi:beta,beta-carotene 9',10'-dioxygenase
MGVSLPSTFRSFAGRRVSVPLEVHGSFPQWLRGTLLRNGPGCFDGPAWSAQHAFDGLALLQRFAITNGQVHWSARFLDSPLARLVDSGRRVRHRSFSAAASRTWYDIARDVLAPVHSGNANVSIQSIHGRVLAMTETPCGMEVDPQTLATIGTHRYGDERTGMLGQTTTAHPLHDRERDEWVNLVTKFSGRSRYYRLWRSQGARRIEFARLPVNQPSYLHSFGMSRAHVVVAEFPLLLNPFKLLLAPVGYIGAFSWKPQQPTRLRVVSREDGRVVAEVETDACFAFHHINCYDDADEVVVDCCVYPDPRVISSFAFDVLAGPAAAREAGRYLRWRIGLTSGKVRTERLAGSLMEFVSVAPAVQGRRARHAYAVGSSDETPTGGYDQLLKLDDGPSGVRRWREPGVVCGEPLFISHPERQHEEDAGVVLALCHVPAGTRDFLLALDAASWQELGRAYLPEHVPYGFHGCFLPQAQEP